MWFFLLSLLFFQTPVEHYSPLDGMPVIKDTTGLGADTPVPKRDSKYVYYLQSSVKIRKNSFAGSGTICYYDKKDNTAYVISCGHLFNGSKTPPTSETCQIIVFYKNNVKLTHPQTFNAEVVCYNQTKEISFLKFKPDWTINHYFAIASEDYDMEVDKKYESTGCDNAEEVASYTVQFDGIENGNILTTGNSPRPGRSGGGLLSADGYYLGIVWGTT
jgi:hypothetical protein